MCLKAINLSLAFLIFPSLNTLDETFYAEKNITDVFHLLYKYFPSRDRDTLSHSDA